MPSFLHAVTSYPSGDGIVVGWPHGQAPRAQDIAIVFHAWTKALFDLSEADVRVAFAPAVGESEPLTEMRARADTIRMYRDAMRTDDGEPSSETTTNLTGG